MALAGSRLAGAVTSRWRGLLRIAAAFAFVILFTAWIVAPVAGFTGSHNEFIEWPQKVSAAFLVFLVSGVTWWWVQRIRRRVVVETFTEYGAVSNRDSRSGHAIEAAESTDTTGAATLLAVELEDLRRLYAEADDERGARSESAFAISQTTATLQASETNELFTAASAGGSNFSIGPLTIPLGLLLGMASRLVRGPRLIGSIHRENGGMVITAQMIGGPRADGWRVARQHGAPDIGVDSLVHELACQIFTEAFSVQPCNRAAALHFTQGLRSHRACLRTPSKRTHGLHEAERSFREATAADETFARAYHNLGIVYSEMNRLDSAEQAFAQAIARDGSAWAPYYALAQTKMQQAVRALDAEKLSLAARYFRESAEAATQASDFRPRFAKAMAHNLAGLAERELAGKKLVALKLDRDLHLSAFVDHAHLAARYAALNLALVRIRYPGAANPPEMLAGLCFRNLGIAWDRRATRLIAKDAKRKGGSVADLMSRFRIHRARKKAAAYLTTGVYRRPNDPHAHYARGKAAFHADNLGLASRELRKATRIDPGAPQFASRLAKTLAYTASESNLAVVAAASTVLDSPTCARDSDLERVAEAYKKRGLSKERQEILRILETRKYLPLLEGDVEGLSAKLAGATSPWERAMVSLALSRAIRIDDDSDAEAAKRLCEDAIMLLRTHHAKEIAALGLHAELAIHYSELDDLKNALRECELAIELAPLDPLVRETQGDIFRRHGDWDHACIAWTEAILCAAQTDSHWRRDQFTRNSSNARDLYIEPEPQHAQIYLKLGRCYLELADRVHDQSVRRAAISHARDNLEQALDLLDSRDDSDDTSHELRLSAHFWLGRAYTAMCNYEAAYPHLEISRALKAVRPVPTLWLAEAHLLGRQHEAAERLLRVTIAGGEERSASLETDSVWSDGLNMPVSQAQARANLLLAVSLLERDAQHEAATEPLEDARRAFEEVFGGDLDDDERRRWHGRLAYCTGLLYFRSDEFSKAEKSLRASLYHEPTPEAYLVLAQLQTQRVSGASDPAAAKRVLEHGRSHVEQARLLDCMGRHAELAASVENGLTALLAGTARRRRSDGELGR